MARNEPVTLAAVTGAHGITGEVRLKLFGEGVESLKAFRAFNAGALTLKKIRSDNKGGAVARFAEVTDRNEAEALRGTVLTVPRDEMPALDDGEYYHADLLGLSVQTPDGTAIGTVVAVENFGATDIIEVERPGGKRFMVPMTAEAIPSWDAERLVIDPAYAEAD